MVKGWTEVAPKILRMIELTMIEIPGGKKPKERVSQEIRTKTFAYFRNSSPHLLSGEPRFTWFILLIIQEGYLMGLWILDRNNHTDLSTLICVYS